MSDNLKSYQDNHIENEDEEIYERSNGKGKELVDFGKKREPLIHNHEVLNTMQSSVKTLLSSLGEDPDREGLLKTPLRMSKALLFFTQGYEQSVDEVIGEAIFNENHHEVSFYIKFYIYKHTQLYRSINTNYFFIFYFYKKNRWLLSEILIYFHYVNIIWCHSMVNAILVIFQIKKF